MAERPARPRHPLRRGRTIAVAVIVAGAIPLCGARPDDGRTSAGWWIDADGRAEGGRMPHLVPGGCGPNVAPVHYGGLGGRFEAASDPPPETSFAIAAEADVRVGSLETDFGSRTVVLFRGTPTLGVSSEYFGAMVGAYAGNVDEGEQMFGFFAGHLRFGTRDVFYMRLDLLDQPECFLAECLLGTSMAIAAWDEAVLEIGASLGIGGGRVWARVPFEGGDLWYVPAGFLGGGDDSLGPTFGVSIGIMTPR